MNALIKKEQKMDHLAKPYLQLYTEFISGYKQYKLEKENSAYTVSEETESTQH